MPRLSGGVKKTTLSTVEQYELNQWLEQNEIHSNNLRRSFTDVLPLARLLSRHYPELIDLNIYPPRNSVHNKVCNWESFNKRVLSRLGVHLTREQMMRVARSVPGSVDLLLYSVMRVQVSNERKRREREEQEAASSEEGADDEQPDEQQPNEQPSVPAMEEQKAEGGEGTRQSLASGSTHRTAATMPRTMKQAKAGAGAAGAAGAAAAGGGGGGGGAAGGRGMRGRNRGTKTGMANAMEPAAGTNPMPGAETAGGGGAEAGAGGLSEQKRGELLYELITELYDPKPQQQQQQQTQNKQQRSQQQRSHQLLQLHHADVAHTVDDNDDQQTDDHTQFKLLDKLTPQQKQKRTVLYSHYMQAVKSLQLKNAKIARIDQCTAHLENMLQLKCDRIEDLRQQVAQARRRLKVVQEERAAREQQAKKAAAAAATITIAEGSRGMHGKMLKSAKRAMPPEVEEEMPINTKAKKARTVNETRTGTTRTKTLTTTKTTPTTTTTTTPTATTSTTTPRIKLMPKNTRTSSASSSALPLKLRLKKISKKLPNAFRAYLRKQQRVAYGQTNPKTLIPLPPMPDLGGDGFGVGVGVGYPRKLSEFL